MGASKSRSRSRSYQLKLRTRLSVSCLHPPLLFVSFPIPSIVQIRQLAKNGLIKNEQKFRGMAFLQMNRGVWKRLWGRLHQQSFHGMFPGRRSWMLLQMFSRTSQSFFRPTAIKRFTIQGQNRIIITTQFVPPF